MQSAANAIANVRHTPDPSPATRNMASNAIKKPEQAASRFIKAE
jgi:hypothetical protein